MTIKYFIPKPIARASVRYLDPEDHENLNDLVEFTNGQFRITGYPRDVKAQVYDYLHDTWVTVKKGDWVFRGIQGEFYPHDGELLKHTHDEQVPE